MMKRWLFLIVLLLTLTACAPAAAPAPEQALPVIITVTDPPATETPVIEVITFTPEPPLPLATQAAETFTPLPPPTETPIPTDLPPSMPTATAVVLSPTAEGPVATETLLPPLELPTERAVEPLTRPWVGMPTYLADSLPNMMVRLDYDPQKWVETQGNFGEYVLASRDIEYCVITPWSGHGLPPELKSEHEFRQIGSYYFDVNTVTQQDGTLKFVAYVGGDAKVMTGFQVTFAEDATKCLAEVEALLLSFRPIVATPTITPTPTLTPDLTTTLTPAVSPTP